MPIEDRYASLASTMSSSSRLEPEDGRAAGHLGAAAQRRQDLLRQRVVVSAEIRSNPHPLGALLLRTGKITEPISSVRATCRRDRGQAPARRILVSLGVIRSASRAPDPLPDRGSRLEVMSWNEGYFSFTEETESKVRPR